MRAKILVLEDEEHVANMIRIALSMDDYHIKVASDGSSALQIARDWSPDLALLDVMLGDPEMDGFEVCRRIRRMNHLAMMPIIMITAKMGIAAKTEGFQAGADDYITKPFDVTELKLRIEAQLWRMRMLDAEREELNRLQRQMSRLRLKWRWVDYLIAAIVGMTAGGVVVATMQLALR